MGARTSLDAELSVLNPPYIALLLPLPMQQLMQALVKLSHLTVLRKRPAHAR